MSQEETTAHSIDTKLTLSYPRIIPREEIEACIVYLSQRYPKCFTVDPRMRQPLKHGILDDLAKERVLDADKRQAAVMFYTKNWTYRSLIQAGVQRVDLNGNKAGVVTEQEAYNTRKALEQEKQEKRRNFTQMNPIAVMSQLHNNRLISTDALAKLTFASAKQRQTASPFGRIQKLVETLTATADGTPDEDLKQALVAATLKVLIAEAQQLVERHGAQQ